MPRSFIFDSNDEELSPTALSERLKVLSATCAALTAGADVPAKQARCDELTAQLAQGWDQLDDAPSLQRKRTRLADAIEPLLMTTSKLGELVELLELAVEEGEAALLADVGAQVGELTSAIEQLETAAMLDHPHAAEDAYLDIHFGSGGVESQDWTTMLKRMYVGFANKCGWKVGTIEETPGEIGLKSVTMLISGTNVYGMLRTETGVHRLVRKSPFDSNHRRHTTFASVFAYPVLPESGAIEINPADLRVDTYRASGAGGQHVNTTDSAVRITHLPTNIVVQCQNSRSQHQNRATAMSMLRSRLETMQREQEDAKRRELEETKADISWGSQIRSYVLDQSRVKDLRTGVEGSPQMVLDGDLQHFIDASLRAGL